MIANFPMATAAACSAEKHKYKITEQPLTSSAFVHVKNIRPCALSVPQPSRLLPPASFSDLLRTVQSYALTDDVGPQGKFPVCHLCINIFAMKAPKLSLSLPSWTMVTNKSNQSTESSTSSTCPHHAEAHS